MISQDTCSSSVIRSSFYLVSILFRLFIDHEAGKINHLVFVCLSGCKDVVVWCKSHNMVTDGVQKWLVHVTCGHSFLGHFWHFWNQTCTSSCHSTCLLCTALPFWFWPTRQKYQWEHHHYRSAQVAIACLYVCLSVKILTLEPVPDHSLCLCL